MASVLLMSKDGDGVPLAVRMAQEGSIVKTWFEDPTAKRSLKGYQNPTRLGKPMMLDQYDLILYDMAGMGDRAKQMSDQGRLVMGGGILNDALELDRNYGIKVAKKLLKVKIPNSVEVSSKEQLLKSLTGGQPKVIKPHGNKIPGLTLVGRDDNESLISFVQNHHNLVLPATVQDKIDGLEVSTEGWFDGNQFRCFNHTIECKRLMHGDHGPMTGCMGNVVWKCEEDELVRRTLLPLQPLLQRANFLGPIDVNCIVNDKDAYFLEFTPRFGYDAIQAYTELMPKGLFQFLWQVATGETPVLRDDYSIAVRLSMPPYPSRYDEMIDALKGVRVLKLNQGARSHVFLSDVMKENNHEVMAGVDGVVGCATARSSDLRELRRRVYRTIRNCVINDDVQYRTDIGLNVEREIGDLKTWGWLDAS